MGKSTGVSHPEGRVAELFAGVGGFRLGLSSAGWKIVFSNQWEPSTRIQHASDVYKANFGPDGHSNCDIAKVTSVPSDFDLLVGGFPCQDYSVAKSARSATGLEGKKGVLWWEILRLVAVHKPKLVFLENVDRLLKSPSNQRGRDFAVMLSTLGREGYVVEWRVVNAADYGFPQRRRRVFIIGRRADLIENLEAPSQEITKSGVLAQALPVYQTKVELNQVEVGDDAVSVSQSFNQKSTKSPFSKAGIYVNGVAYSCLVSPKYKGKRRVLGEVLQDDAEVSPEFWLDKKRLDEWKYLKGAKAVARVHKESGYEYKYSEGAMSFPDSLSEPSRTILTGEGGSGPSRFKHVVRTKKGFRRLTPVELERLSGFPDGWTAPKTLSYKISDGRRAFFVGNALVTGLVKRVGIALRNELDRMREIEELGG